MGPRSAFAEGDPCLAGSGANLDRRIREGRTKREALRALMRHPSRDLSKRLTDVPLTS